MQSPRGPFFVVIDFGPPRDPCTSLRSYVRRSCGLCGSLPLSDLLVHPGTGQRVGGTPSMHCCFTSIANISQTFKQVLSRLRGRKLSGGALIVFSSSRKRAVYDRGASSPGGSPCTRDVGIPFVIHFPRGMVPQVSDRLLLSSPSVVPAVLKLYNLRGRVPTAIRKQGCTKHFAKGSSSIPLHRKTLCVGGVSKRGSTSKGIVSCFPISEKVGARRCAVSLAVSQGAGRLGSVLLFGSLRSPCRVRGLP